MLSPSVLQIKSLTVANMQNHPCSNDGSQIKQLVTFSREFDAEFHEVSGSFE